MKQGAIVEWMNKEEQGTAVFTADTQQNVLQGNSLYLKRLRGHFGGVS